MVDPWSAEYDDELRFRERQGVALAGSALLVGAACLLGMALAFLAGGEALGLLHGLLRALPGGPATD